MPRPPPQKKRWRVEAQLIGEREAEADPAELERLTVLIARPDFVFEIREHVAFCFCCIGRTLAPEEQAALTLREVLGFTGEEAASVLGETGACWQCRGIREWAPEVHRGVDLVQIEVAPGLAVTPENLFDARLTIAREVELEHGTSRVLHDDFFEGLTRREELFTEPSSR